MLNGDCVAEPFETTNQSPFANVAVALLERSSTRIVGRGLVVGPGGNTDARVGELMRISPSGYAFDEIGTKDWVAIDITSGHVRQSEPRASSESAMHLVIYRARHDVMAIVHTHPLTIGGIGARLDEIPSMFPDQVVLVGTMPCIDYVVPCSPEPADAVVTAMQNHGLLTIGHTLKEAYFRAEVIGDAARVNWIAASMGVVRAPPVAVAAEIPNLKSERYRQRLRGAATPHPD